MKWRKSTYSNSFSNCVEVADGDPVRVRDSKDPDGPVLVYDAAAWAAFTAILKEDAGRLPG